MKCRYIKILRKRFSNSIKSRNETCYMLELSRSHSFTFRIRFSMSAANPLSVRCFDAIYLKVKPCKETDINREHLRHRQVKYVLLMLCLRVFQSFFDIQQTEHSSIIA